ncbi:His-Xaa-Ser repeat protein HxsA [Sinorhizobium meliloti]|uniref:His-Xaa-Ser repeat protein HxsA n=1 Tax=Rhizobium meliloti TaxID=382 RepID=UPI000FD71FEB|nr:His-Xaa-Ser repeat protein HxsA [Sinorhizobium meliloti]RVO84504.1 His-Xaa-Ser repeat protein HxsA [Sinorhizobium meliloti]RVQ10079.1 His-Xaa-Ser repeat protein HxsA [Sinorhizobium meliloti]
MKSRLFLIPSLLVAGFLPSKSAAMPIGEIVSKKDPGSSVLERLRLKHVFTLAGHRSHSSHRSHRSHSSHRSSSGGGYNYKRSSSTVYSPPSTVYSAPSTVYSAPSSSVTTQPSVSATPVYPLTSDPATAAPLKTLPGNTAKFKRIVMQVQTALTAYGYYEGLIDGQVGPAWKKALVAMQTDYNLKVTGTITPDVLNTFGIAAN